LIVTNPEVSSVRDADRVIGLVESQEKGPAQLLINRMVLTRVKRQEMLSMEDIIEVLSTEVIGVVPEDEAILMSTNKGTPVTLNGKGPAATAFHEVARRLIGDDVPLRVQPSTSLLQRLFGKA
jgi:septum site-determining protein MinD